MIMDSDDDLPEDFLRALDNRYEGWELAELLDISVPLLIEAFEDLIRDYYNELCEEVGYKGFENDED